jgi:hypothetical protein
VQACLRHKTRLRRTSCSPSPLRGPHSLARSPAQFAMSQRRQRQHLRMPPAVNGSSRYSTAFARRYGSFFSFFAQVGLTRRVCVRANGPGKDLPKAYVRKLNRRRKSRRRRFIDMGRAQRAAVVVAATTATGEPSELHVDATTKPARSARAHTHAHMRAVFSPSISDSRSLSPCSCSLARSCIFLLSAPPP